MGSRGLFIKSGNTGIPLEERKYDVVGMIDGIKVLKIESAPNNPSPPYSNSAMTIYFSFSKERHRIEKILFYQNHQLCRSVDCNPDEGEPHAHDWWPDVVGRKRHDKNNIHPLTKREQEMVEKAYQFNAQYLKQ